MKKETKATGMRARIEAWHLTPSGQIQKGNTNLTAKVLGGEGGLGRGWHRATDMSVNALNAWHAGERPITEIRKADVDAAWNLAVKHDRNRPATKPTVAQVKDTLRDVGGSGHHVGPGRRLIEFFDIQDAFDNWID